MLGQNVFSPEFANDCVYCASTSKQQHKILPKQASHCLFGEFDILLRFQYIDPSTSMKQMETQHYNDTLLPLYGTNHRDLIFLLIVFQKVC